LEALTELGFDQEVVEGISKMLELYSTAWGPGWVEALMGIETVERSTLLVLKGEVKRFSGVVAQPGTTQSTDDDYDDTMTTTATRTTLKVKVEVCPRPSLVQPHHYLDPIQPQYLKDQRI